MDPNEQLQANLARMKAAAQKKRPVTGMVCSTDVDKTRPATTSTTTSTSIGRPGTAGSMLSGGGALGASSNFGSSNTFGSLGLKTATSSSAWNGGTSTLSSGSLTTNTGNAETEGQEMLRKKLDRLAIAPAVDLAGDVPRHIEPKTEALKLDISDTRSFLGQPPPKVGMIQCYIVRDKSGNKYNMYLEEKNVFLMASVKRKKNKTSNYLISLDAEDLNRDSGHFYGKLRANFVGTEFTIFDKGEKPGREGAGQGVTLRQEMGAIVYERNILGTKGPRKMCALLPAVDEGGKRTMWKPHTEEEGLIATYKKGNTKGMMILKNKDPSWNEQLKAYVLNFNGRVTMASVKNFQLVDQDNTNKVLLQFGKVSADKFTLDFQYPLCGLQAFGIALSSFDSKLACE